MADTKIEKCPYCKNECYATDSITLPAYRCWVACNSCHYRSVDKPTKAEAVAAHNRVSRANAIADSYAGLFEAVESDIDRMKERSHAYDAFDDLFDDPFVQAVYKAYTAVLDAEEGT